jgi:hypothetical protein
MFMPEPWTGRLIGKMHNNGITYEMLADKVGFKKAYVCAILNSRRKPPNIQQRFEKAVADIIAERKE